jgi:hypothetical protein
MTRITWSSCAKVPFWSGRWNISVEVTDSAARFIFKRCDAEHALGVNMFRTSTEFLGVGPFGRNDSPDVLPAV